MDSLSSKIDLDRWIAMTLGNLVILTCFAIFLFGANFVFGNSTP